MKLFVSYSRLDRERVKELVRLLRRAGHSVWFDAALVPGQDWLEVLRKQIRDCDAFVPTISDNSVDRRWCKWEIAVAIEVCKPLLPVLLRREIELPATLAHVQFANFSDATDINAVRNLLGGLARIRPITLNNIAPILVSKPKGRPPREIGWRKDGGNIAHRYVEIDEGDVHRNKLVPNFDSGDFTDINGKIVAVDFGTTSTVCAAWVDGAPVVIPNRLGWDKTPSAVYVNEDGSFLVGRAAAQAILRDPRHGVLQVKRLFGKNCALSAYGRSYTAPQLAAAIIKELMLDCSAYFGYRCTQVLATAPAFFSQIELDELRLAYEIAGISVRRIIAEPVAACMALKKYFSGSNQVLVFDLGGGTFDASLVEVADVDGEIQMEVLSIGGESDLGGSDYDEAIAKHCTLEFLEQTGFDISGDAVAQIRLREAVEAAKIDLTSAPHAVVHVPVITADASGPCDLSVPLSIHDFEEITEHLTERTIECSCEVIHSSGELPSHLVLSGDASRTPLIRREMEKLTECKSHFKVEPDRIVALGAAVQAAVLEGNAKDVLLLNVTPHALGILNANGSTTVLLDRHSPFPYRSTEIFSATQPNQSSVLIDVVELQKGLTGSGEVIFRFSFDEITPNAEAGATHVAISFDTNENGSLIVQVLDVASRRKKSVRVDVRTGTKDEQATAKLRSGMPSFVPLELHSEADAEVLEYLKPRNSSIRGEGSAV